MCANDLNEDHRGLLPDKLWDVRSNEPACGSAVPVLGAQPGVLCLGVYLVKGRVAHQCWAGSQVCALPGLIEA